MPLRQTYPNVARCLADWLAGGAIESPAQLAQDLWRQTAAAPLPQPPGATTSRSDLLQMPAPRPAA